MIPCGFLLIPALFKLTVPIPFWGQSGSLPEATGERALIGETAAECDLPQTQFPFATEKSLCCKDAALDQKLVRREPGRLLKQPLEMVRTYIAGRFRDLFQGDPIG